MRRAPASANAIAVASPIPDVPPVMSTRLVSNMPRPPEAAHRAFAYRLLFADIKYSSVPISERHASGKSRGEESGLGGRHGDVEGALRVVDDAGGEVAPDFVGQVLVKSPTAFSGYLGQPEATHAVMRDGWYTTGDLGFLDRDGYLTLVDRAKDMIVSGGENVYSVEVERALLRHPAVATAAVIGTPDPKWGEKVTAFVVRTPGATASAEELKHHCRELLAGYKVPQEIVLEDALPMTASGKVQKATLRKQFWGGRGGAIG